MSIHLDPVYTLKFTKSELNAILNKATNACTLAKEKETRNKWMMIASKIRMRLAFDSKEEVKPKKVRIIT